MKNSFYYYKKQNELCLKLALLPLTLAMRLIVMAYKAMASRFTPKNKQKA